MSGEKRAQEDDEPQTSGETKKLKTQERNERNEPIRGFSQCPHEILLMIFKYLNIREVCQMARVCKKWKRVAYDEILWYHVNLSHSSITLKRLWKLIRHRCFSKVQSIQVRGSSPQIAKSQQLFSAALLAKLNQKCGRLSKLCITLADLNSISSRDLPPGIGELRLIQCEIPVKWFTGTKFSSLTSLSLDSSSRIDFTHLRDLNAPELRVLSVKNCYRIDDRAIEVLTDSSGGFSNLVEIYLDYTRITSLSLQLICKFYKGKLEKLSLKGCKVLSVDEKMRNYIKHSLTDCQTILE